MCVDMCTDMCVDMCADMCTDMCTNMCINMCAPGRTQDDVAQPMHMGRVDACSIMYTPAARGARALLRERMYVHQMVHVIDT